MNSPTFARTFSSGRGECRFYGWRQVFPFSRNAGRPTDVAGLPFCCDRSRDRAIAFDRYGLTGLAIAAAGAGDLRSRIVRGQETCAQHRRHLHNWWLGEILVNLTTDRLTLRRQELETLALSCLHKNSCLFTKFLVRSGCSMSSLHSEPDEMLTSNVAASQKAEANCRTQTLDVAALALRYRPFLKAIAAAEIPEHLRSREDDSDLVQETLLKATRQADQFRGSTEKELESWLRETMLNQIRDCVRFHGRQQRDVGIEVAATVDLIAAGDPSASELVRSAEAKELTQRALHDLPEEYRSVLLMRQQLDLSFVEIADRMQRSPDAVRMLWGRAIMALGEKLKSLK